MVNVIKFVWAKALFYFSKKVHPVIENLPITFFLSLFLQPFLWLRIMNLPLNLKNIIQFMVEKNRLPSKRGDFKQVEKISVIFFNWGGVRNEVQRLIQDQEKQLQLSPL